VVVELCEEEVYGQELVRGLRKYEMNPRIDTPLDWGFGELVDGRLEC